MASRLPAEVNFQKFIELAQVFKSSMDLVEDRNPLKRPLLTLGSTTEEGFKYMEESITQLSKENECNSRAVEAIYYRLSRIFGDDPPNNIPSEFKLKTFHRAVAVFEKEKFQFRRKFEDVISTKCGTVKVPVGEIDILGDNPPRIVEASLCLRESDVEKIKAKRSLMLRFNMASDFYDIHALIWSLWIDEKMSKD
uniref:Tetratricopeptide repeat (TPR)-like superfamily protein n=1 Tax=Heterorhabditis bacteriophora TaxID=37862 RepID=A0A1I7WZW2_HETBA